MLESYNSIEEYIDMMVEELSTNAPFSSGSLSDSITPKLKWNKGKVDVDIYMADYGIFLDKGVNGTQRNFNSPYSFGNKMPPPSKLDGWVVRSGMSPRDNNGKFLSRKSVTFAVAKGIQKYGIRPRNWIEPTLNPLMDGLAEFSANELWDYFEEKENKI